MFSQCSGNIEDYNVHCGNMPWMVWLCWISTSRINIPTILSECRWSVRYKLWASAFTQRSSNIAWRLCEHCDIIFPTLCEWCGNIEKICIFLTLWQHCYNVATILLQCCDVDICHQHCSNVTSVLTNSILRQRCHHGGVSWDIPTAPPPSLPHHFYWHHQIRSIHPLTLELPLPPPPTTTTTPIPPTPPIPPTLQH